MSEVRESGQHSLTRKVATCSTRGTHLARGYRIVVLLQRSFVAAYYIAEAWRLRERENVYYSMKGRGHRQRCPVGP